MVFRWERAILLVPVAVMHVHHAHIGVGGGASKGRLFVVAVQCVCGPHNRGCYFLKGGQHAAPSS